MPFVAVATVAFVAIIGVLLIRPVPVPESNGIIENAGKADD